MPVTRPLLVFFAVAFAFSWLIEAIMIGWHLRIEFIILATLGPTLGALAAQRLTYGDRMAFRWNVSWSRTLTAALLGVGVVIASFVIIPAIATVDGRMLQWKALISLGVYNYSTLLGGPLFEEPGWRGFALPRLEARFGPLPAALLLGAIWASWHLPMFWYPGLFSVPIWLYFLMTMALSVILTATANLARFGVIAPILAHAVFNTHDRYLERLFRDVRPGNSGFLPHLAQSFHTNVSISFDSLFVIGGWIGAVTVIVITKGRLAYSLAASRDKPTARPIED